MAEKDDFAGWTPDELRQYFLTGQGPDMSGKRPTAGVVPPDSMLGAPRTVASDIEPNPVKRMMAGAGMAFENKFRGLTGQPKAEAYGLDQDPAGQFGAVLPDAVGSMAVPARIVPQALYGAATRAIEPAEDTYQRGRNALQGAAEFGGGQMLANGIVRGANAVAGNLSREGQVAAAAKGAGLDLTAGDVTGSKMLRLAEEKSIGSPSRNQAEQIAAIMSTEGGDPITLGIMNAYQNSQSKVAASAAKLDELIGKGNLPNVIPRNTYETLQQIAKRSPDTLKNIRDPELQAMLQEIATYPAGRIPKGMQFGQLDELRKALGPVMAKVEMQAKSGASNVTTADANRWKQLYKGIMDDIDGWGGKSVTDEALAAHRELRDTFKNEILPMREHPIAGKVIDGKYERPEDLVRDLTSPRNRTVVSSLYDRLDQGGQNAFDAIRMAQRGSREFVRGEPSSSIAKPLALTGALTAPAWLPSVGAAAPWIAGGLAAEQGLVHGLNSVLGKAVLTGSPQAAKSPLANSAIYGGLRTAVPQGILRAMRGESEQ